MSLRNHTKTAASAEEVVARTKVASVVSSVADSSDNGWELVCVKNRAKQQHTKKHDDQSPSLPAHVISKGQDRPYLLQDSSSLSKDQIDKFRTDLQANDTVHVAQNACRDASNYRLTKNRRLIQNDAFTFSDLIEMSDMDVTDQEYSGRCWLFAFLNLLRLDACKVLDVGEFEFSEAYLHFFDKLEKANAFLENIMKTSDLPLDDRELQILLEDPIGDGGEFQMAVSLIEKYGVCPIFAYPESYSSESTGNMNDALEQLLMSSAHEIRNMINNNGDGDAVTMAAALKEYKTGKLEDVFRILVIHLGTPPTSFDWEWRDEDGVFHQKGSMTPLEFYDFVVDNQKEDKKLSSTYVWLVHDPRHAYYQNYTAKYSQTVVGGCEIVFLNVPIEEMKKVNQKMILDGRAVWFACNVGEEFTGHPGLWDQDLYNMDSLYGIKLGRLSKEERIRFGYPMGTHAMLMTGVDILNGHARRWKVENSWGTEGGHDGYYTMNDNWYDEYVFVIACPTDYLTDKMNEGSSTDPVVLPPWDPICNASKPRRFRRR